MTDRLARVVVATLVSLAVSAAFALWHECAAPWHCRVAAWPPHLALEYRP